MKNVVRHIRGNISKWRERFHVDERIREKNARRWNEHMEAEAAWAKWERSLLDESAVRATIDEAVDL